jgi:hypothetical protein
MGSAAHISFAAHAALFDVQLVGVVCCRVSAEEVRVLADDKEMLGVMSLADALALAEEEVGPGPNPETVAESKSLIFELVR